MILLIDTSTSICRLIAVDGKKQSEHTWDAGRDMARGLLEFIIATLDQYDVKLMDLEGIGVFRGPGSFTGLRIGIATANTTASFASIPVLGENGDGWRQRAIERLRDGIDEKIVLPEYGRPARITSPRK